MEKDNITKWKIILPFLCFVFSSLYFFYVKGQTNYPAMASNVSDFVEIDTLEYHTQKTYTWKKGNMYRTITLTSLKGSDRKNFLIITEENERAYDDTTEHRYIRMPVELDIKDFYVFEDVFYFCGIRQIPISEMGMRFDPLLQATQKGFIAFVPADSLFDTGFDQVSYVQVGNVIDKIIVFKDKSNSFKTTVYAMGTEKIILPPYELPAPCLGCPSPGTVIPPPEYYDFVVLYDLSSTSMKYLKSSKPNWFEKFQDISVSTGCVELVSLQYRDTVYEATTYPTQFYTPEGDKVSNKLIYRKFKTPEMISKVNCFDIRFYNNQTGTYFDDDIEKGIYNLKIDCIMPASDNFYLTFNYYEDSNTYSTILNKVKFNWGENAAQFNCLLSTEIYRGQSSRKIWDVEFDGNHSNALVLMESIDTTDCDAVYEVPLSGQSGNYFNYSTPAYDFAIKYMLPNNVFYGGNEIFNGIPFSSITRLEDDVYRLAGCLMNASKANILSYFQFRGFTQGNCQTVSTRQVKNKPFPVHFNYETQYNDINVGNLGASIKTMTISDHKPVIGEGDCQNTNLD